MSATTKYAAMSRRAAMTAAALTAMVALAGCNSGGAGGAADGDMALGAPEGAKLTVVEYASVTCHVCAAWQAEKWEGFKTRYVDTNKVRYVFREIPTPPSEVAVAGFLIARCAGGDKYFDVVHELLASQDEMRGDPRATLFRVGNGAGLSNERIQQCITDEAALDTVVSVLAGRTNTAFVGALHAAGARGVGLTGADAGIGLSQKAGLFTAASGERVDLGLVGQPIDAPATLLQDLIALGYVPVIASIGVTTDGSLLNVNADTVAGHLAGMLRAERLIIAGGTAGVLDEDGRTIESLTLEQLENMIASGVAHSGMVAKLTACRSACARGVQDVSIVSGRDVIDFDNATGTRVLNAGDLASAGPRFVQAHVERG